MRVNLINFIAIIALQSLISMKKEKRIKRNMTKMNQVYKWDGKMKNGNSSKTMNDIKLKSIAVNVP